MTKKGGGKRITDWIRIFRKCDKYERVLDYTERLYWGTDVQLCPLRGDLFRAYELLPPQKVRVVIVGQDPAHTLNSKKLPRADGVAFSSNDDGMPWLVTTNRIIETIHNCGQGLIFDTQCLDQWAAQGVLLINMTPISRLGYAHVYGGIGWQAVTIKTLSVLSLLARPMVFMLWGAEAHQAYWHIRKGPTKRVLYAAHPRHPKNEFVKCSNFVECNRFLTAHGEEPIDWNLY